jgi:predicted GTPase
MAKKNVIIIGAAGRDFHNFNTYFRDNEDYNVVAFTAAQIIITFFFAIIVFFS